MRWLLVPGVQYLHDLATVLFWLLHNSLHLPTNLSNISLIFDLLQVDAYIVVGTFDACVQTLSPNLHSVHKKIKF